MKAFLFFVIFIGLTKAHAQTINSIDTTVAFASGPIDISFSPSDVITNISYSTKKFASGRRGIEISLKAKRRDKPPIIKADSIIFKSSTNKY
ncbi:MAG: hypothetical protein ABIN97_16210 [Ginsengibacter sp.]